MKISDLAVHKVSTIAAGTALLDCAKEMRRMHVGSLVVIENDRPVGIITDRDITIEVVAMEKDVAALKVDDVMSAPVCTASCDEEVTEALARMREQGIRRLPVVDHDGKLCGIVTASNLIEEISVMLDSLVRAVKSSKTRETAQRPL